MLNDKGSQGHKNQEKALSEPKPDYVSRSPKTSDKPDFSERKIPWQINFTSHMSKYYENTLSFSTNNGF